MGICLRDKDQASLLSEEDPCVSGQARYSDCGRVIE